MNNMTISKTNGSCSGKVTGETTSLIQKENFTFTSKMDVIFDCFDSITVPNANSVLINRTSVEMK